MTAPGSGPYALHAKVSVFGRKRVFIGSMNPYRRSLHLNAEIGLIIDSPGLANQIAAHFADIAQPADSHMLRLSEAAEAGHQHLIRHTLENGTPVDYEHEPGVSEWLRLKVDLLALLPLDELL